MLGSRGLFCTSWEAENKERGLAFSSTLLFPAGPSCQSTLTVQHCGVKQSQGVRWGPGLIAKGSWISVCLVQQSHTTSFLTQHPALTDRAREVLSWKSVPVYLSNPKQDVWLPFLHWETAAMCRNLKSVFFSLHQVILQMPQKSLGLGAGSSCAHTEPQQLSQAPWPGMKQLRWNAGAPTHGILRGIRL